MLPTQPRQDLPRTIGFLGAIGVMVGIIIGSGIFRTPTDIAKNLDQPWLILSLWGVGGLIALFGAFTYAELATMYPESGGVYVFLREGYGRCMAFVFGWTYMLVSKPVAAAGIAVVMSQHLLTLLNVDPSLRWILFETEDSQLSISAVQVLTCSVLITLTAVNVRGTRLGAGIAGILTSLKILALLSIVALGLATVARPVDAVSVAAVADVSLFLAIAPVMAGIMWTYDGWSDVGAIAGEVRNPQRLLPRIYLSGTILVTLLYVAVNAVYMKFVPLAEMRTVDTVAPLVMNRLLGASAAVAVTAIIVISAFGSTHGSIITGARVTFAQANDGLLFRWLAGIHPRYQTPARALVIQCTLSCVAILWLGTFQNLANGFMFTMWIFYGLAAGAIFILRRRLPDAERPFRCWGYPFVPALFLLAAVGMTVLTVVDLPWKQTLLWISILIAGVPVYYVWKRTIAV